MIPAVVFHGSPVASGLCCSLAALRRVTPLCYWHFGHPKNISRHFIHSEKGIGRLPIHINN
jgi:hypothetical protein